MLKENSKAKPSTEAGNIAKRGLGDVLISLGRSSIYIPEYIKSNAKTTQVPKLVKQFEELIKYDNRFCGIRTSEIFHKGELKRMPKVRGYWMSHINIA